MLIVVIFVALTALVVVSLKWQKGQQAEELAFTSEHSGWDVFISSKDRTAFAVDPSGGQMAIGKLPKYDRWDLRHLASVEIEKNGQTAVVTNRGSQALGATVGGLLLGPLGLLMGGVTGSKRQHERVNQLAIKIVLNDRQRPVHRVVFFKAAGKGVMANNALLVASAQRVEHFHALLTNALSNRSTPSGVPKSGQAVKPTVPAVNLETRIAALWDLKIAGALTEEEFSTQKASLLSGGAVQST